MGKCFGLGKGEEAWKYACKQFPNENSCDIIRYGHNSRATTSGLYTHFQS